MQFAETQAFVCAFTESIDTVALRKLFKCIEIAPTKIESFQIKIRNFFIFLLKT